jgi:hypothetical protein
MIDVIARRLAVCENAEQVVHIIVPCRGIFGARHGMVSAPKAFGSGVSGLAGGA